MSEILPIRKRTPEEQVEYLQRKLMERLSMEAELLKELDAYWSFDNGQYHTHSWHDKQDFLQKWRDRINDPRTALTPTQSHTP